MYLNLVEVLAYTDVKLQKKLANTITVKYINAVAISFSRKIANSYQCNFSNRVLAFSPPFPNQIVV